MTMNDMQMPVWTIEMDLPVIEMEIEPPTLRAPYAELGFMSEIVSAQHISAAADWFTERDVPPPSDGRVEVFGEPVKLKRRGAKKAPAPKAAEGPGPSLESVLTSLVEP